MLSQTKPPFRAEHIGSLLRPKALLDQRGRFARGEIDRAALTAARILLAKFAGREVAAVERLLEERVLVVGPELADVRIGLDHRITVFHSSSLS